MSPGVIETVLLAAPYPDRHAQTLEAAFAPARVLRVSPDDSAGVGRALEVVDVAIVAGRLDERFLEAPRLRWVHCDAAGIEHAARPEVFQRGLTVTASAGRSAPVLAEHVFFLLLSLVYDATGLRRAQDAHRWRADPDYGKRRGLYEKTMGIVGMGHTGEAVASRARAFGMRVLEYRRGDDLAPVLRESDVLVLSTRLTDETHHLVGADKLRAMKRSAFLVNIARGAVVDEPALVRALREGWIAGAGLDTFEQEPLPEDSPLWDLPNVVITPHQTPEMPDIVERSVAIIAENARRYRAGEPLLNALAPSDVYTRNGR